MFTLIGLYLDPIGYPGKEIFVSVSATMRKNHYCPFSKQVPIQRNGECSTQTPLQQWGAHTLSHEAFEILHFSFVVGELLVVGSQCIFRELLQPSEILIMLMWSNMMGIEN